MTNLYRPLLIFSLLILSPMVARAQLTIEGNVKDERGDPLPAANVLLRGTSLGTATDHYGAFKLFIASPPAEIVVEARFLGYKSARRSVSQRSGLVEINFTLTTDALQMDEVVVTGTSVATEKRQLGNTIATVSARDLEMTGSLALDRALSGKIAGALVQQNSGNP